MSTNNRNHSFSLQPRASEIINMVKDQKKSGFVSDAIVLKFKVDAHAARVRDGVTLSDQEIREIARSGEVADDEANHVPQVGVLKAIFHKIRSFRL